MQTSRLTPLDREILKDLRLRVETADPLYKGQKKLKLRGKDLRAIPAVLFTMMELEVLDMSPERQACLEFRLPLVPPSIGRLINLKVLMLDTNEINRIPKEICLLQSLERLSLSNNILTELPVGFSRMRNLRSLHMANNRFDTFPIELCDVTTLQFLDISCNFLMTLPDQISNLKELSTLILNYNKLIRLPSSLCTLTDMECLWLGNNSLRELPRDFGNLVRLDWGYRYTSSVLEKNPLMHPPIEICRQGPRKIREYFEQLESIREPTTPEFEEEELLISEPNATDTETADEKEIRSIKSRTEDSVKSRTEERKNDDSEDRQNDSVDARENES